MTAGPTPPPVQPDCRSTAAERARTVATRPAASVQALGLGTSRLLTAATLDDGRVLVVVPRSGGLAAAVRAAPEGDLAAKVTVVSRSAQPLRNPLRARLELAGWLTSVPAEDQADLLLPFAAVRPDDVLLDVGLTATLLRLDVAEVLLHEGGGWTEITPEEYAAARPDPLGAAEDDLVAEHAGPWPTCAPGCRPGPARTQCTCSASTATASSSGSSPAPAVTTCGRRSPPRSRRPGNCRPPSARCWPAPAELLPARGHIADLAGRTVSGGRDLGALRRCWPPRRARPGPARSTPAAAAPARRPPDPCRRPARPCRC